MNPPAVCMVVNSAGREVAELKIRGVEDGWYEAALVADQMPADLRHDLSWYSDVVGNQMLSYLDGATAAVDRHGLAVLFADGSRIPMSSLQLGSSGEAYFRLTADEAPTGNQDH